MSDIRQKAIQGINVGDSFTVTRTFTEEDMLAFAGITRDYNPVHFDDRFAAVKKINGRICHGLMVAGMLTEIGGCLIADDPAPKTLQKCRDFPSSR